MGPVLGLEVSTGMRLDELVDVMVGSKKARLDWVLGTLSGSRPRVERRTSCATGSWRRRAG